MQLEHVLCLLYVHHAANTDHPTPQSLLHVAAFSFETNRAAF